MSGPPNLSYIANPVKLRKMIKQYDYKGNFSDIQHIMKVEPYNGSPGKGSTDISQVIFATSLRGSPVRESSEKRDKRGFDLNFSKEKPIIDHNYRIGSNFLPPINAEAKKNL